MNPFKSLLLTAAATVCSLPATAQMSRLTHDLEYRAELSSTLSNGDFAPFWLTANRYGLSSVENNSGYLRGGLFRPIEADAARNWRIGFGADIAVPVNYTSDFVVQQLYADVQYKLIRLTVGQKEYAPELHNPHLSSGGMTEGINARPIPQVRVSLPEFWTIPGTKNWVAIKGHLAYGAFTDGKWQQEFTAGDVKPHYTRHTLYHSKAGYLRIGNTDKFPVTITGGFEMVAQFGGEAWNVTPRDDDFSGFDPSYVEMANGPKAFWDAFIPGGEDASDGDYANIAGNHLGSYLLSLKYHGKGWSARAYAEHFFEDHSQLYPGYGWWDMLYGIEIELPRNPFVSTFLYENFDTRDQTGGLYHDKNHLLPIAIAGTDNYYNHSTFSGWQHWGQAIGNPLITSPIYNPSVTWYSDTGKGRLWFADNRVTAHHFGLAGQPHKEWNYRLLFTHIKSLGTYAIPRPDPVYGNYFLCEIGYQPRWAKGLTIIAAAATNGGDLVGSSQGGMLTLRYNGFLK